MIEVADLKKSYGLVKALQGVGFNVRQGEIVGLLGPNGAGKTTLIKLMTGFLQPDEGRVLIDGLDVVGQTRAVQSRIGYLPENAPLYPELTVQSYLRMMAEMRSIQVDEQPASISKAVLAVGLEEFLTRPIGQLSKGLRQRVGLAQAILHEPALLILDEPTIGLDPTQIVEIRELIRSLSSRSTIFFSTHILPEVEALCDRVIILMNGAIRADARLSDLARAASLSLALAQPVDGVEKALRQAPGVSAVERISAADGAVYRITVDPAANASRAVFQIAAENNWPVVELRRDVRTLESIFNELAVAA